MWRAFPCLRVAFVHAPARAQMADTVQRMVEDMVPELEDYKRRKLFTPEEIKSIVRKRTDFEYMLQVRHRLRTSSSLELMLHYCLVRRGLPLTPPIPTCPRARVRTGAQRRVPLLVDYLRYLQYEMTLDQLRIKRKQRLGQDSSIHIFEKTNSLSDYALTKRIHFIFERALRKFSNDLGT